MRNDIGGARRLKIDIDLPCPTVMGGGVGNVNCSQYELVDMRILIEEANGHNSIGLGKHRFIDRTDSPMPTIQAGRPVNMILEDDGKTPGGGNPDLTDKPPYAVPLMAEIRAIPWNGYKVASTFSGCGGSCTGYRMAGFKVVWANEFVPAAQDSYRANMEPDCILDGRDIKKVTAKEILQTTGLQKGELDLFDGSPPCQAFSTAGKREKGWGKLKSYEHGAKQKNEELFFDYIRLLDGLQPKVFVAENVSGLVKGVAKGFFLEILAGLKACGYNVKAKLLDAQWLGVPQMRQRIIFIGVRNDLGRDPVHPKPLGYRYSVRDALPWITKAIHDTGGNSPDRWAANVDITDKPSPSVTIGINSINSNHYKVELLPPSRQGKNAFNTSQIDPNKPCASVTIGSPGNDLAVPIAGSIQKRKFTIAELKRICAFPDDFILTGSYAQQWERLGNSVPPVMMYYIAKEIQDSILDKPWADQRN